MITTVVIMTTRGIVHTRKSPLSSVGEESVVFDVVNSGDVVRFVVDCVVTVDVGVVVNSAVVAFNSVVEVVEYVGVLVNSGVVLVESVLLVVSSIVLVVNSIVLVGDSVVLVGDSVGDDIVPAGTSGEQFSIEFNPRRARPFCCFHVSSLSRSP